MNYARLAGILVFGIAIAAGGCRIESQLGPKTGPRNGPPPKRERPPERRTETMASERGGQVGTSSREAGDSLDVPDEIARRCRGGMTELNGDLKSEQTLGPDCFVVDSEIEVEDKVTVEPGSTFVFGDGAGIAVKKKGRFRAEGRPGDEIIFSAEEPIRGYWKGIRYGHSNSTHNVLRHVVIAYAGDGGWGHHRGGPGNLTVDGARLEMENVVLQSGEAAGLYIYDQPEALTMRGANVLTGNGFPAAAPANALGMLSAESDYTGNDEDFIILRSHRRDADVTDDATWPSFNAPIQVQANVEVTNAHLEIADGNELVFQQDKGIQVEDSASMAIAGTPQSTVTFRGEEPVPGYWQGVRYGHTNSAKNSIQHVVIQDGGSGGWGHHKGGPANLTVDGGRIETARDIKLENSGDVGIHMYDGPTFQPDCGSLDNADGIKANSPPC